MFVLRVPRFVNASIMIRFKVILSLEGKKIISIDALFGLPRRKNAGRTHREPIQGHLWFLDQKSVDDFVDTSSTKSVIKSDDVGFIYLFCPCVLY